MNKRNSFTIVYILILLITTGVAAGYVMYRGAECPGCILYDGKHIFGSEGVPFGVIHTDQFSFGVSGQPLSFPPVELRCGEQGCHWQFQWTPQVGDAGVHNIIWSLSNEWGSPEDFAIIFNISPKKEPEWNFNESPVVNITLVNGWGFIYFKLSGTDKSIWPEGGKPWGYLFIRENITDHGSIIPQGSYFQCCDIGLYSDNFYGVFTWPLTENNTGTNTATFIVSDRTGLISRPLNLTINVLPGKPIANAGPDQEVNSTQKVTLNGTGSYAPSGGNLFYSWSQLVGPVVDLSNTSSPNPFFTAPNVTKKEKLTFQLIVNNSHSFSDPDTVDITIKYCEGTISLGQHIDKNGNFGTGEIAASGAIQGRIFRGSPEFNQLVYVTDPNILFKDEDPGDF